jgi:hypothetical protein
MDVTNWLVLAAALIWVVVATLFYGKNRPDHHFDWVRFHFAGGDFRRDFDDSLYRSGLPDSGAFRTRIPQTPFR